MRTTYGKLVYVLMDAQIPDVKNLLDFSCVVPIKTVYSILEEFNALDVLRDDLVTVGMSIAHSVLGLPSFRNFPQPHAKFMRKVVLVGRFRRTSGTRNVRSKLCLPSMRAMVSNRRTLDNVSTALAITMPFYGSIVTLAKR